MDKATSEFITWGIYPINPDKFGENNFIAARAPILQLTKHLENVELQTPRAVLEQCFENETQLETSIPCLFLVPSPSGLQTSKRKCQHQSEIAAY